VEDRKKREEGEGGGTYQGDGSGSILVKIVRTCFHLVHQLQQKLFGELSGLLVVHHPNGPQTFFPAAEFGLGGSEGRAGEGRGGWRGRGEREGREEREEGRREDSYRLVAQKNISRDLGGQDEAVKCGFAVPGRLWFESF
jgi:hypothetical protein